MTTEKCRECGYRIEPGEGYQLQGEPQDEFLIHWLHVRLDSDLTLESRTKYNSMMIDRNNQLLLQAVEALSNQADALRKELEAQMRKNGATEDEIEDFLVDYHLMDEHRWAPYETLAEDESIS